MSNSTVSLPSRQTKAGSIRRVITISFALAGRCEVRVSEFDGRKSTLATYLLERIPSDFGTAFRVRKMDSDGESYDVLLDGNRSSCDCKWGTYKPNTFACRHIEICLAAIREGKLPPGNPEAKPAPQRETCWEPRCNRPAVGGCGYCELHNGI